MAKQQKKNTFTTIRTSLIQKALYKSDLATYLWANMKWARFFYPLKTTDRITLAGRLYKEGSAHKAEQIAKTIPAESFLKSKAKTKDKLKLISLLNNCGISFDPSAFKNKAKDPQKIYAATAGLFPFKEGYDKKFLFISGSPRSGTTALGRLLNLSQDIALQMERFNQAGGYHPAMLQEKNVKSFNWDTYRHKKEAEFCFNKLDDAIYTGDKRPNFLFSWNITKQHFSPENIKIIHIIRDIEDIALSYCKRALNDKDKWHENRDHKTAVHETNHNNEVLKGILNDPLWKDSVLIVNYNDFFSSKALVEKVFQALNLTISADLSKEIDTFLESSQKILKKDRHLSKHQQRYIDKNFDQELHNTIKTYALQ